MITILCAGSRGDFQPYIALAQELKKLEKEVRIVGGKSFEDFIKSYDIGFYPFGSKPVYRKNLTADKLASVIEFALNDNIIRNSKALCKNIATENEAKDCAKIILECSKQ